MDPRAREAAFRDLVTGLVDARVDLATQRFDAELEAAEAAGRVDPATARVLRWWQRESVRAVSEHARAVVPSALLALEQSAAEAAESVDRSEAAWSSARATIARQQHPEPAPADPVTAPSTPPATPASSTPPASPASTSAPARPTAPPPSTSPGPASTPTTSTSAWSAPTSAPTSATPPTTSAPSPSATSPSAADVPPPPTAAPVSPQPPPPADSPFRPAPGNGGLPQHLSAVPKVARPADPGETENRRRTLLAGLTVLPRPD